MNNKKRLICLIISIFTIIITSISLFIIFSNKKNDELKIVINKSDVNKKYYINDKFVIFNTKIEYNENIQIWEFAFRANNSSPPLKDNNNYYFSFYDSNNNYLGFSPAKILEKANNQDKVFRIGLSFDGSLIDRIEIQKN